MGTPGFKVPGGAKHMAKDVPETGLPADPRTMEMSTPDSLGGVRKPGGSEMEARGDADHIRLYF